MLQRLGNFIVFKIFSRKCELCQPILRVCLSVCLYLSTLAFVSCAVFQDEAKIENSESIAPSAVGPIPRIQGSRNPSLFLREQVNEV